MGECNVDGKVEGTIPKGADNTIAKKAAFYGECLGLKIV